MDNHLLHITNNGVQCGVILPHNKGNLAMNTKIKTSFLSSCVFSPLSDLGGGTAETEAVTQSWADMTEEQRQRAFDEVKATVNSGDTDLEDYKNAYKDAYTEDTTLADDDIIWMIARYELNDPDMDAVVIAMKDAESGEATGDEPDADETLKELSGQLNVLAQKLADDRAFTDEMALIVTSKEIVARGPVSVVIHLERIWDQGDWAKVPVPGSKAPEKGKPSNMTVWDITPTRRGNRKINVSWYEETAKAVFPKVWDDLADINETFKATDERDLNNPQRREFMKLPPLKRVALKSTFTTRKNTHLNLIRQAVRVRNLRMALKDIANKDGKHPIGVEYAWETPPNKSKGREAPGVLLSGSSPILVYDALAAIPTEKVGGSYTVMTFLKFEAGMNKMLASGVDPSYTELDATLQRNREAMAAQKRANRFKVESIEDCIYSLSSNANYLDQADALRAFKKHLETKKKKNEDGTDPRLMTEYEMELMLVGEMMMNLNPIFTYVKANGFDQLWEANKKGEKLTFDDILTEQDKAKVQDNQRKVA